jgi:hypothetical protein
MSMAINLMSLVSQVLTPQVVARIASALGIDPTLAQKLVDVALPTVLAALAGVAATPAGAQKISEAVSGQDSGVLDKITASAGGSDQGNLTASGTQLLGTLLGGDAPRSLSGALSTFAGTDQRTAGSVLGLVAPAIIGTLGQQDPDTWSDGASVAKLFQDQKDSIAAALPAGLDDALSSTGILKGFEDMLLGEAPPTTGVAARPAATAAPQVATAAATSPAVTATSGTGTPAAGGIPSWVWVIVAIVVIAVLAWFFYFKPAATVKTTRAFPTAVAPLTITAKANPVARGRIGASLEPLAGHFQA